MKFTRAEMVDLQFAVSHRMVYLRNELLSNHLDQNERNETVTAIARLQLLLNKLCQRTTAAIS